MITTLRQRHFRGMARRGGARTLLLAAALCGLLLSGCQEVGNANGTPIVIFPTAISGSPPPTFGGGGIQPTIALTSSFFPTNTPFQNPPTFTPPPILDNNWLTVQGSIQWRTMQYRNSQGLSVAVVVVRIDPTRAQFLVAYTAGQTRTLPQWVQALTGATVIINANFFDTNNNPIGLVVSNGRPTGGLIGRSDAGMFQVKAGTPSVRSMWLNPISPQGEGFEQVAQGFPILMALGQVAPINADLAAVSAPRSVVAQDRQGRILLIATQGNTTLGDLGAWLGASGLDLNMALNLDGGSSVNLYMATSPQPQGIIGSRAIPVVIAVYAR